MIARAIHQRFNPDLLQLIPAEQLDASLEGGLYPHEFEHETYWSQMCAHAGVRGDGTRFIPDWKQERGREREQEAEVKTDSPLESSEREEQLEGDDATECAGGDGRLHENGKIHGHGDVDYDVHVVPDAEGVCFAASFYLVLLFFPVRLNARGPADECRYSRSGFTHFKLLFFAPLLLFS